MFDRMLERVRVVLGTNAIRRQCDEMAEGLLTLNDRMRAMSLDMSKMASVERQPEPTYVFILPPSTSENTGMMAQRWLIPKNIKAQITFEPVGGNYKGSWVVAVGPAFMTSVRVGHNSQEGGFPSHSPIFRLCDECLPGTRITVILENGS